MYANQAHIVLVHFPVLGSFISLFLGWKAFKNASEASYKYFYWSGLFLAITGSIAYFSGVETANWLKNNYDAYNQSLIENHALIGRIGFIFSIFTGVLGIMGVSAYAQDEIPHKVIPYILLIITVISILIPKRELLDEADLAKLNKKQ